MMAAKESLERKNPLVYNAVFALVMPPLHVAIVLALLPLSMFCGYCDMRVWNWFAAPYFHLPALGFWPAFGFNLWLASHQYREPVYKDDERRVQWFRTAYSWLITHGAMLAVGAGVHRWGR